MRCGAASTLTTARYVLRGLFPEATHISLSTADRRRRRGNPIHLSLMHSFASFYHSKTSGVPALAPFAYVHNVLNS